MATSPSTPALQSTTETIRVSSNDITRNVQNDGLKSDPVQGIQKATLERPVSAGSRAPLPGTYYLKANEARGKHMVQYVYANISDPNDTSLPFHVRERYKEIERERLQGYQQAVNNRGTSPNRQYAATSQNHSGTKMPRPASASYERRSPQNSSGGLGHKSSRYDAEIGRQASPTKANPKVVMKQLQQTRSSNAVLSPKRGSRSRSKTASPRSRRPFSIAAESTSDTDPIENQRSIESIPHSSPPRITRNKNVRRQQYLATKFKLAAKNSKHTQTFVAAGLSVEESSGSATTVISRHHSTTQTDILEKNTVQPTCSQPDCQVSSNSARDVNVPGKTADAEKPPIAPQNVAKSEATLSTLVKIDNANLEWKRAKVRLRSTPRSPSPPSPESRHRVSSADRVHLASSEKPSCLAGGRAALGHSGPAARSQSAGSPTPPATDKQFATSSTQIDGNPTASTGVQVKLKKRSSSHRRVRKERRSPSQRSVGSKMSSQSGSKPKEDNTKTKKKKKKKKKKGKSTRSREPSIRSLRSLRSFQSDASTGILKHVKIDPSSSSPARSRSGRRATSAAAIVETTKKKKKAKAKKKQTSSKIARFLRTLSKDKEAINVINKMAAVHKKKTIK